jgi:hypothetical protein
MSAACPVKLACLKQFPEGEAEELLTNQIAELDRNIASVEQEQKDEISDNPRTLIARSMRINGIKQMMLQDIIDGRVQSVSLDQFNIKPSRIAELTVAINRLKTKRAEIAVLLEGLAPVEVDIVAQKLELAESVQFQPIVEEVLSEENIIAQLKAQLASLEALQMK